MESAIRYLLIFLSANESVIGRVSDYVYNDKISDPEYDTWLKNYRSPDPKHQEYCLSILTTHNGSSAQFSQDLFLFFNFFKHWPLQGKTGFYVDSGANEAIEFSNTYFFDACLGWSGLCIEPEERYHLGIKRNRTCQLVRECISDADRHVDMHHNGALSTVTHKFGKIKCSTLQQMLTRFRRKSRGEKHVIDLWSLDIEGYEMTVLNSINFDDILIRVLLIEEMWQVTRKLDRKMSDVGYTKYQQLHIDAVYLHRSIRGPIHPWVHVLHEEYWLENQKYRKKNQANLKCL